MKILVIRFSSAGDIVLTSLFVRCLRARFPDATIDYLTKEEFAPLLEFSPHLDRVLALPRGGGLTELRALKRRLRRELAQESGISRYDIIFDLHDSLRSRLMRLGMARRRAVVRKPWLAKWLLVHRKINRLRPIVPVPELYLSAGERFGIANDGRGLELFTGTTPSPVAPLPAQPTIALAPGARHATKQWPPERFAALGTQLAREHGARIVLLGAASEQAICEQVAQGIEGTVVNLAGRTGLLEAAAALDACDAVVANDSAMAHIAAARKRPVIAVFGSTVQEFGFAPYGTRAEVVEIEGLACRPCTTIGRDACPLGHFRCMREIQPERVAQEVRRQLRSTHDDLRSNRRRQ